MSSYTIASKTISGLADKLAKLTSNFEVEKIVVEITELTQEAIVDKVTGNDGSIRPHSGRSRTVPTGTVTDLVDTGHYRASWQVSYPAPGTGRVSSNSPYAGFLEYGTEDMPGFYVARDTARKMKREFVRKLVQHVRDTIK